MKLQILSDLHILNYRREVWEARLPTFQTDADVLVMAGDIVSVSPRHYPWSKARLQEFTARYPQVVYVPGNHEFYGTAIEKGMDHLDALEKEIPNLHFLRQGHAVTIDGQRFIGGTLWQPKPIEGFDEPADDINDHRCISDFHIEAEAQYRELKGYLEKELVAADVVVTHHAPSTRSLADQFRGDPCNRWFITPEMEPLMTERQPKLWVHGHVHTPFDYMAGETRVVCNPAGYPGEGNDSGRAFDPKLVIEI